LSQTISALHPSRQHASAHVSPHGHPPDDKTFTLTFEDNRLLSLLFGEHDEHLALIEHRLAVAITPRGNRVAIRGEAASVESARAVLLALYGRVSRGLEITRGEVDGAIRMAKAQSEKDVTEGAVRTRRKAVIARTPTQREYIDAIRNHELVFGIGPAGTGKTYLAVACAAEALMNGEVDRIVLSRPGRGGGRTAGLPAGRHEGEGRSLSPPAL
jgi:phosphate starvation-inducible PhoH-like protein